MRLYYHPASTTCRMIMLFASEEGIDLDYEIVDLFTGEHLKPDFATINPNCLVPALEDSGFRLTESSAILKYLANNHSEKGSALRKGVRRDMCYSLRGAIFSIRIASVTADPIIDLIPIIDPIGS